MKKAKLRIPAAMREHAPGLKAHEANEARRYADLEERKKHADELDAKTTLRLPRDLWNNIRHQAIDEGVSFQAIVERALAAYMLRAQEARTADARKKGGAR